MEEEALEAEETSAAPVIDQAETDEAQRPSAQNSTNAFDLTKLNSMSTQQLVEYCTERVKRMREASVPWLQGAFIESHGECPTDPVLFPWWFGAILPVADMEKYKLMDKRTVRDRLKICAGWIMRIEAQQWYVTFQKIVLVRILKY